MIHGYASSSSVFPAMQTGLGTELSLRPKSKNCNEVRGYLRSLFYLKFSLRQSSKLNSNLFGALAGIGRGMAGNSA
jgi:hypothetical protein